LMHKLRDAGFDVPLDVFTVKDAVDVLKGLSTLKGYINS